MKEENDQSIPETKFRRMVITLADTFFEELKNNHEALHRNMSTIKDEQKYF